MVELEVLKPKDLNGLQKRWVGAVLRGEYGEFRINPYHRDDIFKVQTPNGTEIVLTRDQAVRLARKYTWDDVVSAVFR